MQYRCAKLIATRYLQSAGERNVMLNQGAIMKLFLAGLSGIIFGALGMWFSLSNIMGVSHQLSTEAEISNTVSYIKLLQANKQKELETSLISSLPCQIQVYEELLKSYFWERTDFSNSLIAQAKQYFNDQQCPN
jgi:hypothetical protein